MQPHPAMTTTTLSVLLVEDDEVVRTGMRFALESAAILVAEADTVSSALRRFHEIHADVVVIDLHLPDGTGYDLAKWLWRHHPRLPLVIISTDLGETPSLTPGQGRMALLAKPFPVSALLDAISRVAADPDGG